MKVPKYNKENRKKHYERLPKGAYVCKIMGIEEKQSKKGNPMVVIYWDIAEGEYKDFYMTQFKENTSEDKHWSYDATMYLSVPYEGCVPYITEAWDTFWADIEDSNNGYVFEGDEKKTEGKTFGAAMRNEQTEYNGNIYDHTRIAFTTIAQNVRDGKVKEASDKLIDTGSGDTSTATAEGFMATSPATAEDLPWK